MTSGGLTIKQAQAIQAAAPKRRLKPMTKAALRECRKQFNALDWYTDDVTVWALAWGPSLFATALSAGEGKV